MPPLARTLPHEPPAPPWGRLALLAAAVLAVHLALLGVAPLGVGRESTPPTSTFVTRSIVIAPPTAPQPAEPPAPAAAVAPAPKPRSHPPARPRPVPSPPAASAPAPEAPEPVPDPLAQVAIDPGATEASSGTGGTAAAGDGSAAGTGEAADVGAGAGAGDASAANMPGSVPQQIPGSVSLAFAVTGQQGVTPMAGAFGVLAWTQDGQRYQAQLSLKVLGFTIRSQQSVGVIGPTGIEPQRFAEKRKTEVASHFVRDQKQIVFSNNTPSVMLLAGAQDRLSVIFHLGSLLAGDPARYPAGSVIAVQTVGPRDAEIWTFNVGGDERVSVPAGEFGARRFTRNPRKPFDDKVELWLSPELGWLPVQFKLTQPGGDYIDLQLRTVPQRSAN